MADSLRGRGGDAPPAARRCPVPWGARGSGTSSASCSLSSGSLRWFCSLQTRPLPRAGRYFRLFVLDAISDCLFSAILHLYSEFSSWLCGVSNPVPWRLPLLCPVVCPIPKASPELWAASSGSPVSRSPRSPHHPLARRPRSSASGLSRGGGEIYFGLVGVLPL